MLNKKKKYIEKETITIRNFIGQVIDKIAEIEEYDAFKQERLINSIVRDTKFKNYLNNQISKKYAKNALNKCMEIKEQTKVLPKINYFESRVLEVLCNDKNIEYEKIRTKTRERDYVEARQCAFYIFREIFNYTYSRVGAMFLRDHSTVIHGIETHNNLMHTNSTYRNNFINALDDLIEEFPKMFKEYTTAHLKNKYGRKQRS